MISIYFQPDWADVNEIYRETLQHPLENGQQKYKVTLFRSFTLSEHHVIGLKLVCHLLDELGSASTL